MNVLLQTGTVASFTKIIVDGFKIGWPAAPAWAVLVVGFVVAQIVMVLSTLATGDELTTQIVAVNVLQGVLAWGLAVGITEAQKLAQAKSAAIKG